MPEALDCGTQVQNGIRAPRLHPYNDSLSLRSVLSCMDSTQRDSSPERISGQSIDPLTVIKRPARKRY